MFRDKKTRLGLVSLRKRLLGHRLTVKLQDIMGIELTF